jgi:hypothetical protein
MVALTQPTRELSIAELLASAPSIEALAALRRGIAEMEACGALAPTRRTRLVWIERMWVRVIELMRENPRSAPYIYSVTLRWPKPDGFQRFLWTQMEELVRPLPTYAEELKAQGIVIEGVTS